GTFNFTINVQDVNAATDSKAFQMMVNVAPSITTVSPLASGVIGVAYSTTLTAAGGTTPYTWSITSGALPSGVTMSNAGVISGSPSVSGTFNFTVKVQDVNGATDSKAFQMTVNPSAVPAPSIISISPNTGVMTGGTAITIGGSDFQNGATVSVDG